MALACYRVSGRMVTHAPIDAWRQRRVEIPVAPIVTAVDEASAIARAEELYASERRYEDLHPVEFRARSATRLHGARIHTNRIPGREWDGLKPDLTERPTLEEAHDARMS